MSEALARLAGLVRSHTGIATKDQQLSSLAAALDRAAPGMGAERFLAEVGTSGRGASLVARLVDEVTVKETYFFRASRELQAIDWRKLWTAAVDRGEAGVRVWVSACATGEEAYTLAILAHEAFGGPPPVSILATDISADALDRARVAEYSDRAVASLPEALRERYFERRGPRHVLSELVKALVTFRQHNLIAEGPPAPGTAAFEVVTCRNVLIYFEAPTVERVTASLESAVAPGGQLILGAADRLSGAAGVLERIAAGRDPGRRTESRAPRAQSPPESRTRPLPRSLRVTMKEPPAASGDRIAEALRAADAGDLEATVSLTAQILVDDPLDVDAHFVRGLAELGGANAPDAVRSFRRALYLDPSFGLAAFQLARAYEALGDDRAAARAYGQALGALDPADERHRAILGQVDLADVADACRARLLSGLRR